MSKLRSHDAVPERSRHTISPPPLKRQRTGDSPSVVNGKPYWSPAFYDLPPRHAHSIFQRDSSFEFQPFQESRSFALRDDANQRQSSSSQRASRSSDSKGPQSDTRSTSGHGSSNLGGCHKCGNRFRATTYGPGPVLCKGCKRKYHDYCCSPSVGLESDLQLWRCETCIKKKRKSSLGLSASSQGLGIGRSVRSDHGGEIIPLQKIPTSTPGKNTFAAIPANGHVAIKTTERGRHNSGHCDSNAVTGTEGPDNGRLGLRRYRIASIRPDHELGSPTTGKSSTSLVRTEIAGTPSQHSSQLASSGALSNNTEIPRGQASQSRINRLIQRPLKIVKTKMPTVPCSLCRQSWVSRRRGVPKPICQDCANGANADPPRSTIPESPEVQFVEEPTHASCETTAGTLQDTTVLAEHSSVSEAKSTSLRAQLESGERIYDKLCESPLPTIRSSAYIDATPPVSAADVAFVAENEALASETVASPRRLSLDRGEIPCTAAGDESHQVIGSVELKGVNESVISLAQVEILDPTRSLTPDMTKKLPEDQQHIELAEDRSTTTMDLSADGRSSPEDNADTSKSLSPTTQMRTQRQHRKSKAYTMRELAQIALVAANGRRLTTVEIDFWLSATFSHLRSDDTGWKSRVRSALSGFDEFHGHKVPGTSGRRNRKSYGFSSDQVRMRYEGEFPQFCLSSASSTISSLTSISLGSELPTSSRAPSAKSVDVNMNDIDLHTRVNHNFQIGPLTLVHGPTLQAESKVSKFGDEEQVAASHYAMPFGRANAREPRSLSQILLTSKRVARYCDVTLQSQASRIDTMTDLEKKQKIQQIKARPTRNQNFGADYRLAHKHRYKLQDIHDERDGAWISPSIVNKRTLDNDFADDSDTETDGSQTLKELLGLPINAIPMNNGQTELAFRDGTMFKEKLPRPRIIYRVGKMFGGDLTVRVS